MSPSDMVPYLKAPDRKKEKQTGRKHGKYIIAKYTPEKNATKEIRNNKVKEEVPIPKVKKKK